MKRLILVFIITWCTNCLTIAALSIDKGNLELKEPISEEEQIKKNYEIKTGWNFGPLPAVGYNSDLGFQYGVLCDIFYFGDGKKYPDYLHKFNIEISTYTKGSTVFHLFYDSKYLIRNTRLTFAVSYLPDPMNNFFGFNGYVSPYDSTYGESFYKVDRELFRIVGDFQGKISNKFSWVAGVSYYDHRISEVKLDKYKGATNLYNEYIEAGIIPQSDAIGGKNLIFKGGIVCDTRNNEADPTKGFYTDVLLSGAPKLPKNSSSFLTLSASHRGYVPVVKEHLTFAYKLAYQGKVAGQVPFYFMQNLTTLYMKQINTEGLGGENTIRGVLRNRIIGNSYVWSNFEFRYRFARFNFINQNWILACNPFFDLGRVLSPYNDELIKSSDNEMIYRGGEEALHPSVGAGIKVIMNRNFVISAEYGKALNSQDGTSALQLGLNYVF